ncbi:hypothetical protein IE81DRAFT_61375 [Ceraceosorus guamensis]|uniref:Uncharacterized protein n=1 Tax=Ceraceosorus guamensis TaxID=1522189 RepID=A0A316W415_9BASI|nr:hypothetical protein IE81DRAFT_61375 [Ceraceosorus guamensis]PWN43848.1 hypothetical protein IE81DRAFT_61375 [Ceraceosorus guamensis]
MQSIEHPSLVSHSPQRRLCSRMEDVLASLRLQSEEVGTSLLVVSRWNVLEQCMAIRSLCGEATKGCRYKKADAHGEAESKRAGRPDVQGKNIAVHKGEEQEGASSRDRVLLAREIMFASWSRGDILATRQPAAVVHVVQEDGKLLRGAMRHRREVS